LSLHAALPIWTRRTSKKIDRSVGSNQCNATAPFYSRAWLPNTAGDAVGTLESARAHCHCARTGTWSEALKELDSPTPWLGTLIRREQPVIDLAVSAAGRFSTILGRGATTEVRHPSAQQSPMRRPLRSRGIAPCSPALCDLGVAAQP